MIVSTLVGNLDYPENKEIHYETDKERFYLVSLSFGDCTIPAVCSEFLLKDTKGKVQVQGYVTSTYKNMNGKRRLFTYFQIINLASVKEEVPFDDTVVSDVTVTRVGNFQISEKNGRAYLPLVGICYTGPKRSAVIHMLATETIARQLKSIKVGTKLVITGHFHQRGEPIEIILSDVKESLGKEEAPC